MVIVAFLVLPSTIGLVCLAGPITSVLYERGAVDATDRLQTAAALRAYGYGLLFYAWLKVLQPAFYAIEKRWLPLLVSVLALATNAGLNAWFVLVLHLGHESLALTTSISAVLNFIILYVAMRRFAGSLQTGPLAALLVKLAIAGAVMATLCLAADRFVFANPGAMPLLVRAAALAATIAAAAGVFFAMSHLLRVAECREATAMLVKKIRRA